MQKAQLRAARALLGWSQEYLSRASGVSIPTIRRIEAGDGELRASSDVLEKIELSLIAAGVELIGTGVISEFGGVGVRLKGDDEDGRLSVALGKMNEAHDLMRGCLALVGEVEIADEIFEALERIDGAVSLVVGARTRLLNRERQG